MPYKPIEIDLKILTIMGLNFVITIEHQGILTKEADYGEIFPTDAKPDTYSLGLYQEMPEGLFMGKGKNAR